MKKNKNKIISFTSSENRLFINTHLFIFSFSSFFRLINQKVFCTKRTFISTAQQFDQSNSYSKPKQTDKKQQKCSSAVLLYATSQRSTTIATTWLLSPVHLQQQQVFACSTTTITILFSQSLRFPGWLNLLNPFELWHNNKKNFFTVLALME